MNLRREVRGITLYLRASKELQPDDLEREGLLGHEEHCYELFKPTQFEFKFTYNNNPFRFVILYIPGSQT